MKADEAKKLTENAFGELTAALEAGHSEKLTAFLSAIAHFHHYSFGNVLLIAMQRPDATRVAGFNAWKKLNRWVKKGEHGIAIIAPMVYRKDDTQDESSEERTIRGFKVVHVFDLAQTEGESLPDFATVTGDPGAWTESLKDLVTSRGIELQYSDSLGSAHGLSCGGTIKLAAGLTPSEEFSVLVHELAHEALHHGQSEHPESRTTRETEAEAVAFIVCHAVGLDTNNAAADYIQLYQGDKDTLAQSLDRIQATASGILTALQPGS
jgi:antirestriction protein ArdC